MRVVAPDGLAVTRPLRQHRYLATRRAALTDAADESASACPNVEFLAGTVEAIVDGPEAAAVRVGDRRSYAWLDAIFLWVLAREPARAPAIFATMMRRPDGTLRLLDERATLVDIVLLLIALPKWVFLRAALRWLGARRQPTPPTRQPQIQGKTPSSAPSPAPDGPSTDPPRS